MSEVIECPVFDFRDRTLLPHDVEELNMRHIAAIVQRYVNGEKSYYPTDDEVAKAAIALQRAYRDRNKQRYDPAAGYVYRETDEEARARALGYFGNGYTTRGVSWGVKKANIPHKAGLGEYVVIQYRSLGHEAVASGFVTDVVSFPRGKGWVIRLTETDHGFGLGSGGWRYVSLWVPANGGMAGFI